MTTADISVTRIKELIADERTRPQALDEGSAAKANDRRWCIGQRE